MRLSFLCLLHNLFHRTVSLSKSSQQLKFFRQCWGCGYKERHVETMVTEKMFFFFSKHLLTVALELRIVCALPRSSTTPLRSLSRCLSARVIEGPVAIYEDFYISGTTSKILPSFQIPQVLSSLWISPHMQQGMQFLVNTFHSVKQKE